MLIGSFILGALMTISAGALAYDAAQAKTTRDFMRELNRVDIFEALRRVAKHGNQGAQR